MILTIALSERKGKIVCFRLPSYNPPHAVTGAVKQFKA